MQQLPTAVSIKEFIAQQLNEEQKKAVTLSHGPILVIAGAGSGKTRVITTRIAYLMLEEKVDPSAIVALTFTNKAAKEMQERVRSFLGTKKQLPFIGTFHAYCVRFLKANNHLLKHPFLSILDDDDQQKILSGLIKQFNCSAFITAKKALYYISQYKNKLHHGGQHDNPLLMQLYNAYEKEKRASKCLDFDDLLLETLTLIESNPPLKERLHATIRHLLVDEYQDTNMVQHALLQQLTLREDGNLAVDSLCVVGDEDQSIYAWRGATVDNIIHFKKDFPNTTIISIEQNYRSVQPILDAANTVIQNNTKRNPKNLWSERDGRNRLMGVTCLSEYHEGEIIAQCILATSNSSAIKSRAIVYRSHFQSRAIEEAFVRHAIPYTIIGGTQFYERKEIKDLLAYLRLIINPYDRSSFFRILNCPTRGLGEQVEDALHELWQQEPLLTFTELINAFITRGSGVTKTKKESLLAFVALYEKLTMLTEPLEALNIITQQVQYIPYIHKTHDPEDAQARTENVKELLHAVSYAQTQGTTTVEQFLEEVALMQEKQNPNNTAQNPVLLMTVHAAKGLEFDLVIIAGFEDGILPSSRSLIDLDTLEEERRLLYVAITRAKERLLITHCRYRYTYGKMTDQRISRFVEEIPTHLLGMQDYSHTNGQFARTAFAAWLGVQTAAEPSVFTYGASTAAPTTKKTGQKNSGALTNAPRKSKTNHTSPSNAAATSDLAPLKKYQSVSHKVFGTGVVQTIEKRDGGYFAEVQFKAGKKRVSSQFLTPL